MSATYSMAVTAIGAAFIAYTMSKALERPWDEWDAVMCCTGIVLAIVGVCAALQMMVR